MKSALMSLIALLFANPLQGVQAEQLDPSHCSHMEVFDVAMGMCMPLPMPGMPMQMFMLHGNAFAVATTESGPRGAREISAPNMFMADLGTSVGASHYLNLDWMGTLEKWTYPSMGYPELLQIGETHSDGKPFLDAQHPHDSPIMGLTLSDTISFGHQKDHLKIFIAPRGEATDGPIAFMHRATGMINPDAPLGHHIGQDVGHVSSTVLGASLKLGDTHFEISTFHGAEPDPTSVDLPIGTPDSLAFRIIEDFSSEWRGMISFASVNQPESDEPDIHFEDRYSTSIYFTKPLSQSWTFYNMDVFGLVTHYDHANTLASVGEEFLFKGESPRIWGRIEWVQRTPSELEILGVSGLNDPKWVTAITLGYTHKLATISGAELGLGASGTLDLIPTEYQGAYGGNPWTGKIFLEFSGMGMWNI